LHFIESCRRHGGLQGDKGRAPLHPAARERNQLRPARSESTPLIYVLFSSSLNIRKKPLNTKGLKVKYNGVPGGIRTPDRWLRRPLLYPAELLGRVKNM
jgi:hypothetical protein